MNIWAKANNFCFINPDLKVGATKEFSATSLPRPSGRG
jgi:hypothetical protein